jgi:hypothetical protein
MYIKQNFEDDQILTAAHLNHMEEGIALIGAVDEALDGILSLQQQYLEEM